MNHNGTASSITNNSIDHNSSKRQINVSSIWRKIFVYFLVILFALGAWTNVSGIWIQMPLLVSKAPESWSLPSKLGLVINLASILPLTVVCISLVFKFNTKPIEVPTNYFILINGILTGIVLAFSYNKTVYVFGKERSIYLLLLTFCTACLDTTSSTTFIPFLNRYEQIYLNAYFTGEALTALFPALLGIAQGTGNSECISVIYNNSDNRTITKFIEYHHEPRFSVQTYFLILCLFIFAALVSFIILRSIKTGRLQTRIDHKKKKTSKKQQISPIFVIIDSNVDELSTQRALEKIIKIENKKMEKGKEKTIWNKYCYSQTGIALFLICTSSGMLYGTVPALNTFSLYPYGLVTFHYTIIASKLIE
ncbi:unnamed protein product [Didymodactylos carnosus]|uniref:Riboflavin transporter n=1 Tax=Didymodactylos carnosus TaxID=1234261 RepID=A0A8S2D0D9_9BILA|nr:unnamed protein product [Didymodactylos carnosus]CAF3634989.1 unnamed protein product [Didymodactylos carnosus]